MSILSEVQIGAVFYIDRVDGTRKYWRVTDIGTRVIVAISMDRGEGWLGGPPYAVVEEVFDEDDQCVLVWADIEEDYV